MKPIPKIMMSSLLKSGTWLLRDIIGQLTGLKMYEPPIKRGRPAYDDPSMFDIPAGTFYSWHLMPAGDVETAILRSGAKPVFLVRNIYDITVSMCHHLLRDVDADIGRSTGQTSFLNKFDAWQRYDLVINGYHEPSYDWHGMGVVLQHLQAMLSYALRHGVLITSFERLTQEKITELGRLADYFGVAVDERRIEEINQATSLARMKNRAKLSGSGENHFRKGIVGGHKGELLLHHRIMLRGLMHNEAPMLPEYAEALGMPELLRE